MTNQYTAFRQVTQTHKECSSCGVLKLHSEFHKDRRNKRHLGLTYYCKLCANSKSRAHTEKYSKNSEYKEKKRNSYTKNRYGLTLEQYTEKLKMQNNACSICKVELLTSGSKTHLDHDHKTGQLRAFLCTNCNRGLGHFQEDKTILSNAIEYLQSHSGDVGAHKEVLN